MPVNLIAFQGPVQCRPPGATALLCLSGREACASSAHGSEAELLFSALGSLDELPAALRTAVTLHEVRVLECSTAPRAGTAARQYRIDAREGGFELWAGALQLHRRPAAAFYGALPTEPVPRSARLGWRVLLAALRLPGAARLLSRFRR